MPHCDEIPDRGDKGGESSAGSWSQFQSDVVLTEGRTQCLCLWSKNERLFILWQIRKQRTRLGLTFKALILVSHLLPPIWSHLGKALQLPQLGKKLWKQEPEGEPTDSDQTGLFLGGPTLLPLFPRLSAGQTAIFLEGTHSSEAPAEHAKPLELHLSYFVPSSVRCISPFPVRSSTPATWCHVLDPGIHGGKMCLFWSLENHVILLKFNFKTWNMTELNVST